MSIIVAVKKDNKIVVASDSLTVFGSHREDQSNLANSQKLIKIGSSYLGITGWGLYANVFNHHLAGRKRAPSLNNENQIFTFFLHFLHDMRDKYRLLVAETGPEKDPFADLDSSFLIVNRHGIFGVSGNLSVSRYVKYTAIGSGLDYAYGALHAVYDSKRTARQIAQVAIEAAIHFDADCGGDIVMKNVK